MKRILFAASECVPFIKTGGLADVCGALPKEFSKEEWDVRVVIPNYSCIPEKYRSQFQYVTHFYMCAGNYIQNKYVGILKYELDGLPTILLIIRNILPVIHHMGISVMTLRSLFSSIKLFYPC